MLEDKEGFLYPSINGKCKKCGLCKKVCPGIRSFDKSKPHNVYASQAKDKNILADSTSGGIFTLLAQQILNKGGVVFGARFNEQWDVIHDYVDNLDDLSNLRHSKYVQSNIGKTYQLAKSFLDNDSYVLFSGTPCQIEGLNLFLGGEYANLLTVEVICHGVPSPMIFRKFLTEIIDGYLPPLRNSGKINISKITEINFRSKLLGWKNSCGSLNVTVENDNTYIITLPYEKNAYMRGFLANLFLRLSCYQCPSKECKSHADITLGDFWGVEKIIPDFDNTDSGVSLVMVNTEKGKLYYNCCEVKDKETSYENALESNNRIINPAPYNKKRAKFFYYIKHNRKIITSINKILQHPLIYRTIRKLLISLGLFDFIKRLLYKRRSL